MADNVLLLVKVTGAIRRVIKNSLEIPQRRKVTLGAFYIYHGNAGEGIARGQRKRPRLYSAMNSVDIKCPACLSNCHPLARCYYIFPKLYLEG